MVASSRMPTPRAVAMILTSISGTAAMEANARNRIRAAQVTRRPTRPRPWTTAAPVDPVASYSSRMRASRKTS
jgi:hypothetical protein